MTYRLRRMLLVNVRTSGALPSGMITEIDPRDGAAVIGDNSVGKTTTLELIPLFLGHLPSQIVGSGAGREPMLKFILPAPESAIVFEYQRGQSEQHDLRFVVLRRQESNDAPEYRLFQGGFRKEIFVQHSEAAGGFVFLDDAGMVDAARNLEVLHERRLTAAEFRTVILGHRAATQDAVKLRQLSMSYSLGPVGKSLANLDRLVAAVVKKHVNFNDFVRVVVDMVQEELGSTAAPGGERSKLTMRQSRRQIQDWLVNRDACVDALKLAPKFDELQRTLSEYTSQEAVLRDLRGQVQAVLKAKRVSLTELKGLMATAATDRSQALEAEELRSAQLARAAAAAETIMTSACDQANSEKRNFDHFSSAGAIKWEGAVLELPALRQRFESIDGQLSLAVEKAGDIVSAYNEKISKVQLDAATHTREYEREKAPLQVRCDQECSVINNEEVEKLEEFDQAANAQDSEISGQIEELEPQRGALQTQAERPQASDKAIDELRHADDALRKFLEDAGKVSAAGGAARLLAQRIKHEFEDAERRLATAQDALSRAQAEQAAALASMTPAEGSLLAILRSSPTDGWKSNLARVLNVDLLTRCDLSVQDNTEHFQLLSEGLDPLSHVFGWHLDTSPLPTPAWVDDESAQRRHGDAIAGVQHAEAAVAKAAQNVTELSSKLESANRAQGVEEGKEAIFESRKKTLVDKAHLLRERHDAEKAKAQATARSELEKLNRNLANLKLERKSKKDTQQLARQVLKSQFDAQRADSLRRRNDAISAIDQIIAKAGIELTHALQSLERQRDEHMSESGVDTAKVAALRAEFDALRAEIVTLESKLSLVSQWKTWSAEVGQVRVEAMATAAEQAVTALDVARRAITSFAAECTASLREHNALLAGLSTRQDRLEAELKLLDDLDEQLGGYGASRVDDTLEHLSSVSAADLQVNLRAQRQKLASLDAAILGLFQGLRASLTSRESSVADLINLSLAEVEGQSVWRRAVQLRGAFQRIGPQVVTNVNTTLRTVLSSIQQFRTTITSFETEVKRFNRGLQSGMAGVAPFEWLTDLSLNMVTNFSALGFMKKLEALDDVIRVHASQVGIDPAKDMPPDETAAALRDFMSVIGNDGSLEINLGAHVDLAGSVTVKGIRKAFHREEELAQIDSNGLSNIILIALLSGMLNMIRGTEPIYVPWVTDEVGKYDSSNFAALMKMLRDNRIDVITASPELTISKQRLFARRYKFADRGVIALYAKSEPMISLPTGPALLQDVEGTPSLEAQS